MLRVENITVSFKGRNLFQDFSFALEEPGLYLILGKNGCGKSTLLRIISGRLKPKRGKVFLGEAPLYTLFGEDPPRFSLLNEQCLEDVDITLARFYQAQAEFFQVKPNFGVFGTVYMLPRDADEILKLKPFQLSRSERLEVGLAFALALDPQYIFIDDFYSAFSSQTIERTMSNLETWVSKGNRLGLIATTRFFGYMERFAKVFVLENYQLRELYAPKYGAEAVTSESASTSETVSPEVAFPRKKKLAIVRCGEYFYRHSRLERENQHFTLRSVLENALVLDVKNSLDESIAFLEESGIDVLGVDFAEEAVLEEKISREL